MKRYLFQLMLLFLPAAVLAQENGMIPDRPGMATGVGVLPAGKVLWETGFEAGKEDGERSVLLPTTMFRFGLSDFAELRMEYDGTLSAGNEYSIEPLILGCKLKMLEGEGWKPDISVMANLAVPITHTLSQAMYVAPSLYALFNNDVCDWLSVGYNAGLEWNGANEVPDVFLALNLGFNLSEKISVFLESYNNLTPQRNARTIGVCNMDFGATWLIHPSIQLDLYAGFNLSNPRSMMFAGLGIAWLIN